MKKKIFLVLIAFVTSNLLDSKSQRLYGGIGMHNLMLQSPTKESTLLFPSFTGAYETNLNEDSFMGLQIHMGFDLDNSTVNYFDIDIEHGFYFKQRSFDLNINKRSSQMSYTSNIDYYFAYSIGLSHIVLRQVTDSLQSTSTAISAALKTGLFFYVNEKFFLSPQVTLKIAYGVSNVDSFSVIPGLNLTGGINF